MTKAAQIEQLEREKQKLIAEIAGLRSELNHFHILADLAVDLVQDWELGRDVGEYIRKGIIAWNERDKARAA